VPPHIVFCIKALVLNGPTIVVLISPIYAESCNSCNWVSEKTTSETVRKVRISSSVGPHKGVKTGRRSFLIAGLSH
jgi:hypothetical protein